MDKKMKFSFYQHIKIQKHKKLRYRGYPKLKRVHHVQII